MTTNEALQIFEKLIVQNLAGGAIKDFKTIDTLREALMTLTGFVQSIDLKTE